MKANALLWGWAVLITISASGQIPRSGIECGCDRTGAYLRPARSSVQWNALRSPRGTYAVEPFADGTGLVVRKSGSEVLDFGPNSSPIGWGFGPDEVGLVIHATRRGEPGITPQHNAWLYNLEKGSSSDWDLQVAAAEAVSVFSPAGQYLLYVVRDVNDEMHLWTVEVATLSEVWRHDFWAVPRPGEAGQRFGLAMWGFSPDPDNSSLVYLLNAQEGVSLNLINLPLRRHVINSWNFQGTAEVGFSPCGDLLSLVRYPSLAAEVWLERTLDGTHLVAGASVANFGFLEAGPAFHLARTGSGSVRLAANGAQQVCEDISSEAPYWATGATLTATAIRPTSLRLVRPTAQNQGGKIVAYEFRQDAPEERVLGTLTPKEGDLTVQGLLPETEYQFSVRARNQAEFWTPEPLRATVKTAKADGVPTWPLGARLEADQISETTLQLEWPSAVDDVAVKAYRIFRDGASVATLDGQKRTHSVSNMVVGRSYVFQVQAGDVFEQWSTDGPRLRISTQDRTPPSWPVGSWVYASERGAHRLVLAWTPAEDNVGVYLYSLSLIERGVSRLFAMVDGATTNLVLSCLLPGQDFEFAVEAGDAAGNWSTGGPRGQASTIRGPNECGAGLELASVNSDEEATRGELALGWTDDGQYRQVARSWQPALSSDGRYVVFDSPGINLVPNDSNNITTIIYEDGSLQQFWHSDVFLRDRWAGTTERVSTRGGGGETDPPGSSGAADISGDGRFIVFASSADDLVMPDRNGKRDIFLRDRRYNTLARFTARGLGVESNGHSDRPRISSDGSAVVFESQADNLVPGDTNGATDIFVVTLPDEACQRVNVSSVGIQANAPSWGAAISVDGRFVAFASDAWNLVPGDTNSSSDVFVHDRQTGETLRVSVSSSGIQGNGHSAKGAGVSAMPTRTALSADGRFVAFDSEASNLVAGDSNGCRDVFVHDRETGQTTRVSLTSAGEQGPPPPLGPNPLWAYSWGPDISGDGRFVVFLSKAALVPEKTTIVSDVFLHDRQTRETRRVSACGCGGETEPNSSGASRAAISRDSGVIAFDSDSTNIKTGFVDPNWSTDVFVFQRDAGPADQDGDGTPDSEEQGPDRNDPLYDGDGDGVPDYLQDIVISGFTDGLQYFQSRVMNRPAVARVSPLAVSALGELPAGLALPLGAFEVRSYGAVEPGGELLVEMEFPSSFEFNSYYKYGRVPGSTERQWYEFMYDGVSGAEIDGNRVLLHLVDGVRGDDDLQRDGNLIDPGGPALTDTTPASKLEASPSRVRIEGDQRTTTISLKNSGGRPLVWAITEPTPAWLRFDRTRGELSAAESTTLVASVDRSDFSPGVAKHTVCIRSGGGTRCVEMDLSIPFAFESDVQQVGDWVVFTWRSEPGFAYRVESTESLLPTNWQVVSEVIIAEGVRSGWTDCRGLSGKRFYRVVQSQ